MNHGNHTDVRHDPISPMPIHQRELGGVWNEPARQLRVDAKNSDALLTRANVQRVIRDLPSALATIREAHAIDQIDPRILLEMGLIHRALGDINSAMSCYQRAAQLAPDWADVYYHAGDACYAAGNVAGAVNFLANALQRDPDHLLALCNLRFQFQAQCAWRNVEQLTANIHRVLAQDRHPAVSPFAMLTVESTPAQQRSYADHWVRERVDPIVHFYSATPFAFKRERKDKLRIAYLSADFSRHATAYLIAELFELHDRSAFEIYAYSLGLNDASPIRQRIVAACDHFADVRDESYIETAQRIYRDGIDILVDLKGYTKDSRPQITALRPAPVTVNYLGYPGTMGGDFIDYVITDRYVTPPDQQCHFAEEFVYISDCYQINDRHRNATATTPGRQELGLPEDGFVFCCFNHTYKITASAFATWMRLLKRVPGSVLWLLASNPTATENLRRAAVESGIAAERLVFAPICAQAEHLARYRAADIFLDTFPVTAHTTASDALWMGVPIVTRTGTSFVERVAGSLCHAMSLPQLVTDSWQQYEAMAYTLATNNAFYAETRSILVRNKDSSPLFDSARVTRALEDSYRMMWNRWVASENCI